MQSLLFKKIMDILRIFTDYLVFWIIIGTAFCVFVVWILFFKNSTGHHVGHTKSDPDEAFGKARERVVQAIADANTQAIKTIADAERRAATLIEAADKKAADIITSAATSSDEIRKRLEET